MSAPVCCSLAPLPLLALLALPMTAQGAGHTPPSAPAGSLDGTIVVEKKDGSAREDASEVVLYLADLERAAPPTRVEIHQQKHQFVPQVLAVAAGTTVAFPNDDTIEHNVFSHSANAEFDLGRFGFGPGKSRLFATTGIAEIFCNVHKDMVAYVVVAPSSAFATTARDGSFSIKQIPPGRHQLVIWARFARPRAFQTAVEIQPGATATFRYTLRESSLSEPAHKNKFGVDYAPGYR